MSAPISSSKTIESYALSLTDIHTVDVDKLHALSLSVRWPHRAEDWRMLRHMGSGLAASDEIGRVMATAMWFPQSQDFASIGMVITSPRLQTLGAGQWLMQHALRELEGRGLGLNATRAAERLYDSLGFRFEATVYQRQGRVHALSSVPLRHGVTLRDLGPGDVPQLCALDAEAAGFDRRDLLAEVLPRSAALGLFYGDTLVAYALRRAFGRGLLIGPVIAASDDDALAVVMPHLSSSLGSFVRLDTRRAAGTFTESLSAAGLVVFDTVKSMAQKVKWITTPHSTGPTIYGLLTQATG